MVLQPGLEQACFHCGGWHVLLASGGRQTPNEPRTMNFALRAELKGLPLIGGAMIGWTVVARRPEPNPRECT
jgi:hypothetical protein